MSSYLNDCSCNGGTIPGVTQCVTCVTGTVSDTISAPQWVATNQRIIQNQVRVPSSQYLNSLSALNVRGSMFGRYNNNPIATYHFVNWNQSSDRAQPSSSTRVVPTNGNSTKRTLTSCRPGASCPGGVGVDIKHNSYDRFLARKKAGALRQKAKTSYTNTQVEQAYYTKYSIVQDQACNC
jgi:hypothetical protein